MSTFTGPLKKGCYSAFLTIPPSEEKVGSLKKEGFRPIVPGSSFLSRLTVRRFVALFALRWQSALPFVCVHRAPEEGMLLGFLTFPPSEEKESSSKDFFKRKIDQK